MLSSNLQPQAVFSKKNKGILSGLALLAVSINGALLLMPHEATASSSQIAANDGPRTAKGDAINYEFGTIQLSVTTESSKITAIDLVQAGANGGREQAFSYLVDYAIEANGTNFGNLSGATYTVDAFKQALESAISKLS